MWSLLDVNFDFVDQKVTLWRVGPVVKHGALTGRPGRRHGPSTWTSHAPTYTCEHGPKTQNHVLRPWTWTMPLLKHAPPPQSNVAETWSWKPYGRHHAPCTWPHPHTRYDDTQQVLTTTHSPGCCPRSHRTFPRTIPKLQMRAKTMLLVDTHLTSRGTTPKPSHDPLFSVQKSRDVLCVKSPTVTFPFLVFLFVSDINSYSYTWCIL